MPGLGHWVDRYRIELSTRGAAGWSLHRNARSRDRNSLTAQRLWQGGRSVCIHNFFMMQLRLKLRLNRKAPTEGAMCVGNAVAASQALRGAQLHPKLRCTCTKMHGDKSGPPCFPPVRCCRLMLTWMDQSLSSPFTTRSSQPWAERHDLTMEACLCSAGCLASSRSIICQYLSDHD